MIRIECDSVAELRELVQAASTVQSLLKTLDPEKREVFVLAELEELSTPEISEITGLAPATIYSRLRSARMDFERAAFKLLKQTMRSGLKDTIIEGTINHL